MAYIDKEKLKKIIDNAPTGSDSTMIIKALTKSGHVIEGLENQTYTAPVMPEVESKDGTFENLLQGVGKGALSTITGISSLGERMIRGVGRAVTPKSMEKTLGFQKFAEGEKTIGEKMIPEKYRKPEGTAEKVGFTAEQIAEFFIPMGALSKASKTGKLLKRGAILSTEMAGKTALQKGEIDAGVGVAGALGAVSPLVGKGFESIAKQFKNLPNRFVESTLNRSRKEVLTELSKNPSKSLSDYVLKSKKINTVDGYFKESSNAVQNLSNKIDSLLKSVKITENKVSLGKVYNDVAGEINSKLGEVSKEEIKAIIIKQVPLAKKFLNKPSMSVQNANSVRKAIDAILGDRAFLAQNVPTADKEILKKFANMLRETIKEKAPEGTRGVFDELALEIKLRNAMGDKLAKKMGNQILTFGDFIGGGLGGIFGGGFAGALLGVSARRTLESAPFKIGAAKTLTQFNKVASIISKLTPSERAVIGSLMQLNK